MSLIVVAIFPLLMAFAASSDLLTMRISNRVVMLLIAAFFVVAIVANVPIEQVAVDIIGAVAVLVIAFIFFAFGWIGGGDAKLASATMLWVGVGLALPYLVYAAMLGGALTLAILAIRRWPLPAGLQRIGWIDRLHNSKSGVPYGIALAASGLLVYSDTLIFQRLLG